MMKLLQILSGAVVLTLTCAPMVPVVAQSNPQPGMTNQTRSYRGLKLNLTDAQKAQMKQIRESTRAKIEAVLTDEQKVQLRTAMQQQGKDRQAFRNLNLTDDQQAKIRAIRQESRKQMDEVLTPEQRAQLQQQRQTRQQLR